MNQRSTATDVAFIAVFAALIIVFAFVSIPVGAAGVPIVLQNAVVILTGLVLGPRRGFLAALVFIGLGVVGLPVLAGGRTTLAAMAGPTAGYVVGYLFAAAVAGALAYRAPVKKKTAQIGWFTLAGIAGLACQYLFGAIGLMIRADLTVGAAAAAQLPFIVPDGIKVALMIAIALGVHAAFPDLLRKPCRK